MDDKRTEGSSLCYRPSARGYRFHKCNTSGNVCFVNDDIEKETISLGSPWAYVLQAAVEAVIQAIKKGRLKRELDPCSDAVVKPCVTQPDIWELRWNVHSVLYRMYYSEDEGRSPEFVALSFVRKDIGGLSSAKIRKNQNRAIREAQKRFIAYMPNRWGHADGKCDYCA